MIYNTTEECRQFLNSKWTYCRSLILDETNYNNASNQKIEGYRHLMNFVETLEDTSAGRLTVFEMMLEMADNTSYLEANDFPYWLPVTKLKPDVLEDLKATCNMAFELVDDKYFDLLFC